MQSWFGKVSSLEVDVEDTAHLILGINSPTDGIGLVVQVNIDFVRHDRVRTVTAVCETALCGGTESAESSRDLTKATTSGRLFFLIPVNPLPMSPNGAVFSIGSSTICRAR